MAPQGAAVVGQGAKGTRAASHLCGSQLEKPLRQQVAPSRKREARPIRHTADKPDRFNYKNRQPSVRRCSSNQPLAVTGRPLSAEIQAGKFQSCRAGSLLSSFDVRLVLIATFLLLAAFARATSALAYNSVDELSSNKLDLKPLVDSSSIERHEDSSPLTKNSLQQEKILNQPQTATTAPQPPTLPTTTTSSSELSITTSDQDQDDSSTGHDDDDTSGCAGLSIDEPAKGANLSDNARLVNLQRCIQSKMRNHLLTSTRAGMEMFEKLSLSGGCSASLMNLASSLSDIKAFAFKFIDASAKLPSGVMYGLLSDFGDFDQCMSIRSQRNVDFDHEEEENAYSGKYCLMSIRMNYRAKLALNESVPEGINPDGVIWDELLRNYWTTNSSKGFQVGMCVPSRCSQDDIQQIYQYVAKKYNLLGEVLSCQDNRDLKRQLTPDTLQSVIIHIIHLVLMLNLIGTIIDRYLYKVALKCNCSTSTKDVTKTQCDSCCQKILFMGLRFLVCFSIARNWRIFMRKEDKDLWDCSISRGTCNSPGGKSNWRASVKTESEHLPIDELLPSNSSADESSNKLGQLSINIQPHLDEIDSSIQLESRETSLSHLSGIRLFVILWITIGHSFLYPSANNYQYYRSIINMNITRDSVWFATTNFTLGIDMLLYITGLVFVYKIYQTDMAKIYRVGKSQLLMMNEVEVDCNGVTSPIIKKVLRFWPTYLTLMGIAIIMPLTSDGPMWPEMVSRRLGLACRKHWWTNLLFVNNMFLSESEICLPSSWFVSITMQLLLVGTLIVLIVRKFSLKVALITLFSLLIGSCGASFAIAYTSNIRAPVIRMDESFVMDVDDGIFRLYTNFFNNLGPFLIGMIGGFLLIRRKNQMRTSNLSGGPWKQDSKTSKKTTFAARLINWLFQVTLAVFILAIAALVLSSVFQLKYSRIGSSIYWSLHRVGWAIVTGYMIHQCATGRWKLLKDILSLSTFLPLSRLIFIAYLLYPMFIHVHSGLVRDGLHVSMYNMLNIYITRLVITFITALLIHLFVELPFCSVEEIVLSKWIDQAHKNRCKSSSESSVGKSHPLLVVAPVVSCNIDGMKQNEMATDQLNNFRSDKDADQQVQP